VGDGGDHSYRNHCRLIVERVGLGIDALCFPLNKVTVFIL
jgi:hypothetical protein